MNVLLLGNGFDLNHNLPTKYINFINAVKYFSGYTRTDLKTVGDVFREIKNDSDIQKSYVEYKKFYDTVSITREDIDAFLKLKENIWFSYLESSFNKDIGWIDFEKEIALVIESFRVLLSDNSNGIAIKKSISNKYDFIVRKMNFYLKESTNNSLASTIGVKDDYVIEYPLGSNFKIINKEKLIDFLYKELLELAEGLKLYLKCFIDDVVEEICKEKTFKWSEAFEYVGNIVSFNYTNTFEKLYKKDVCHLHGNINDKIILGINPDKYDDIATVDTTFISFKKYFQRLVNKTDVEYFNFIKEAKETADEIYLYVIGHSLDSTDEDIIKELFSISTEIYILNYNDYDELKHISNLIKIYGKEGFDSLRENQNLTFLPIDEDLSPIMKDKVDYYAANVVSTLTFD